MVRIIAHFTPKLGGRCARVRWPHNHATARAPRASYRPAAFAAISRLELGLLVPVKAKQRNPDGFCEFHRLKVAHPPCSGLDPGNGEPVDIPPLALAAGGEFLLGKTMLVADAPDLFPHEVFSFSLHVPVQAHETT